MKFLWPLLSVSLAVACSTELNQKNSKGSNKALQPLAVQNKLPPLEVRYHCSESASRLYGVLYIGLFTKEGTAATPAMRISGMIPMLECQSRTRNYHRKTEMLPGSNYFCELDSSGSAMLFEQSLAFSGKSGYSTKKISRAMTRKDCAEAAEVKQANSGKLWREI